jgi:hypothetical protein
MSNTPLVRRPTRAIAALLALVCLILGLHALSRLGLRGPTGTSRDELDQWLGDPLPAAATLVRWLALALAYYLAAVVVAVILAGERLSNTPLRYVVPSGLASTIGVLLGLSAVAIPLANHMHHAGQSNQSVSPDTEVLQLVELEEPPTLRAVDEPMAPGPDLGHLTPVRPDSGVGAPVNEETWTVEPGDSFWAIAEEHLRDEWSRAELSDGEVATYWRTLIDANTDRLVEPGNPDLLLPGQVLILPQTPPPNG